MSPSSGHRDHYLPPDRDAYQRAEPAGGRIIVIAPTRAACETIELAMQLHVSTVLEQEHGQELRSMAGTRSGFGVVAGTGTGKTLAIRPIASRILGEPLRVGVVNREREATPETPTWNVVIVTTGIARRWFQDDLIDPRDTLIVDEIHQTSAELELCLALGKRIGCRFIWLSATVDPSFYADYLESAAVLETAAFDPTKAAKVSTSAAAPLEFLDDRFVRRAISERRGVAVFLPTRAEVEQVAAEMGRRWRRMNTAFYHGGEPIRVIRPFLEGTAAKPFLLAMTQAGQSALNVRGLDTVVIYDACYTTVVDRGRNVLTRQYLGANEILQMAGRVHGRVAGGEVHILTDRRLYFDSLMPTPPAFQLAGDSERVALTAAALSVDLTDLQLPVPLDRHAYRSAIRNLQARGLIEDGRLTAYGRDVETMPVDRPWGELLAHADSDLAPYVAVAANIDSLHRMTREDPDLRGLVVPGSDHLTAYNVFAEAVNECGFVGQVYGLPRHLFVDEVDEWAKRRGVLVKALEDAALGTASVMRTLELPLPSRLPPVDGRVAQRFRDLVARVMPFDLAIDGETVRGERVRLSQSSVCNRHSAVAGTVVYFADRFGLPRAAMEGTTIPFKLVQRYAIKTDLEVEYRADLRKPGLYATRRRSYFGFELDEERTRLAGRFPPSLVDDARDALARAMLDGITPHPNQVVVARSAARLDSYWRRSGGSLTNIAAERLEQIIRDQLDSVSSWADFVATRIELDVDRLISANKRRELDELPTSLHILGDRVPLTYEWENARPVVTVRLREAQARRIRPRDLPELDRPVRLSVYRGRREVARASSPAELARRMQQLPVDRRGGRRRNRR